MMNHYYGNQGGFPQPISYYPVSNGAAPDNLAMLKSNQMQYQQPFPQQYQNMQVQQTAQLPVQQNVSALNWVSCEAEAREYPLAPNSAVALWDSNMPVVYLKQSDASGKPTFEAYDLVKRQAVNGQQTENPVQIHPDQYVTRDEFNALEARLDSFINSKQKTKIKNVTEE